MRKRLHTLSPPGGLARRVLGTLTPATAAVAVLWTGCTPEGQPGTDQPDPKALLITAADVTSGPLSAPDFMTGGFPVSAGDFSGGVLLESASRIAVRPWNRPTTAPLLSIGGIVQTISGTTESSILAPNRDRSEWTATFPAGLSLPTVVRLQLWSGDGGHSDTTFTLTENAQVVSRDVAETSPMQRMRMPKLPPGGADVRTPMGIASIYLVNPMEVRVYLCAPDGTSVVGEVTGTLRPGSNRSPALGLVHEQGDRYLFCTMPGPVGIPFEATVTLDLRSAPLMKTSRTVVVRSFTPAEQLPW